MEKREYLERVVAHNFIIVEVDEEPYAVRGGKVVSAIIVDGDLETVTLINYGHDIYDCQESWLPRPRAMTISERKLYKRVILTSKQRETGFAS